MLQDTDVQSLLATRKPNHSLPRPFYTDPDIFQLDLERIWYRSWLFAVPACEIPKAGNYVTHKVGLYSVIIVRGNDGVDPRLPQQLPPPRLDPLPRDEGHQPEDRLPLPPVDLRARRPPALGPRHGRGLRPLAARPEPGPLPRRERPRLHLPRRRRPRLRRLRRARPPATSRRTTSPNSKVAFESTIVEKGNWKLVWENNRECYHCAGNHPSLTRTFPEDPRLCGGVGGEGLSDVLDRHVARCELVGAPSAFQIDPQGRWRFVRMPLLGTAESYTMDGKAAVAKPNSTLPFKDGGALLRLQLSVDLEPLPRRPRDRLPRHPDQRDRDRGLHQVAGPQGRAGGRRLRPQAADRGLGRDQRRGPRRGEQPAGHPGTASCVENNQQGILSPATGRGPTPPCRRAG